MQPLRKRLPLFLKVFSLLLLVYILVYVSHSENGRYEIMMADIGRIEGFGWKPSGVTFARDETKKEQHWDLAMFYFYYPLWRYDYAHFHRWKDAYITGDEVQNWKTKRRPDDFTHLAWQFPLKLSTTIITNLLGMPTRTNVLANGSNRWEYDFQNGNGLTYASLFFDDLGKFQGCSTNANAEAADLN
jgi:hypothetical protein